MKRTATAHWNGEILAGKGDISTQSLTLHNTQYSYKSRFESGVGTNPEELLGASHAGCFTMAVSNALTQAGFTPGDLITKATITLDVAIGAISNIDLELTATPIKGVSSDKFTELATVAKDNCPISKALHAVPMTLTINYSKS